jgi:asparagine synthase (glutamine-hydrolysing)
MKEGELMRVGFTVLRRAKDIEVHISVPDNNEQSALVTYSRVGNSFALLMGHLYYRSDILAELTAVSLLDSLPECQVSDAALALAAYRYLGIAVLERLEGDFAIVIWDAEIAQLIGLRDPLGGYPLFWIQQESTIAFSTSLRPLCALLPQCLLNEAYFAEFVMMQAPRNESGSEQCAYVGIQRVLPGTMAIARADSEAIERRVYWDWLKHIKDPGTDDLVEIAQQYRQLLRTAVQERIRGCTLAQLSGGMDSTSIALLAQDVICSEVSETPLHTASLVYDRLPLLARERPYIESVLHQERTMVAHQLPADDLLDFDIFTNPPLHDEPYTALASLTMEQPFVTLATEIGALTILTGHGADEIHYLLPYYLADMLRQHHFRKAWQEGTKWAKGRNCSPWSILLTFGFSPIVSTWAAGTRWTSFFPKKDADWSIPPWIMPDFARRYSLRSRASENARQIYRQCQQTSLSVTLNAIKSRVGDMFRWSAMAPLGIANAHPFLDPHLLSFGLGMQSRILPEPGKMKPVLAEAMRGILPDAIRSRQRKGHFNEVYYLGLARNLPHLETMIRQAPLEGMIDKELLLQCLQEGSLAGVPPRRLQHADHMLSLLKWLCMQEEWLHIREKVSVTYRIDV